MPKIIDGISSSRGRTERDSHSSAVINLASKIYIVFGGQAEARHSKEMETIYTFDRIDALMLERNPRMTDLEAIRNTDKEVRNALKRGPVCIVIALKLAKGMKYVNVHKNERVTGLGVNAHVTKEATVDGELGSSNRGRTAESYTMIGNVILAYKLQIVKPERWKWRGESTLKVRAYDPGRAGFMSRENGAKEESLEAAVLSPQEMEYVAYEEEFEGLETVDFEDENDAWRMVCVKS